jgi:hypothetical protein
MAGGCLRVILGFFAEQVVIRSLFNVLARVVGGRWAQVILFILSLFGFFRRPR